MSTLFERRCAELGHASVTILATLIVLAAAGRPAEAQDSHYWGFETGARATLLGGAVVSGPGDASASFYQPAALSRLDRVRPMITVVKTVTDFRAEVGGGSPLVATSSVGASAPAFFAAELPVHLLEGDVVTFSYVARKSSRLDLGGGLEVVSPGGAEVTDLFVFQDIYDGWYGLSWARDTGAFAIGASAFLSSVSYRQRIRYGATLLGGAGAVAVDDDIDVSFAVKRVVLKMGALWSSGPVTLGVTATPPSVTLTGTGEASMSSSVVSVDPAGETALVQTRQPGIEADYRKPWSVAVGGELASGPVDLVASAEWFDGVGAYDVLRTESFMGQVPAVPYAVPIRQVRKSVVNFAGGASWNFVGPVALFGSVRSDRSYRDPAANGFIGLNGLDLVHTTAGIGLTPSDLQIWLGLMHASGEGEQSYRVSPIRDGSDVSTTTRFQRLGFILAFSADF